MIILKVYLDKHNLSKTIILTMLKVIAKSRFNCHYGSFLAAVMLKCRSRSN